MLPIPVQILTDTATINYPATVDVWQNVTHLTQSQARVHIQPSNEVRKTQDNTDVVLRAVLFVDGRLSTPFVDWAALIADAEAAGGDVKVTVKGTEYTVQIVETIPNNKGELHHYEVGLI